MDLDHHDSATRKPAPSMLNQCKQKLQTLDSTTVVQSRILFRAGREWLSSYSKGLLCYIESYMTGA